MPAPTDLDLALALLVGTEDHSFTDATSLVAPANPVGRPRAGVPRRPSVSTDTR